MVNAPIRERAAAVRSAEGGQRQHSVFHAKARDKIAGIEAAHAVADDVHRFVWRFAVEEELEIVSALFDASGRADLGDENAIARFGQGGVDAGEIAGEGPAAETDQVEAEQTVNQHNG